MVSDDASDDLTSFKLLRLRLLRPPPTFIDIGDTTRRPATVDLELALGLQDDYGVAVESFDTLDLNMNLVDAATNKLLPGVSVTVNSETQSSRFAIHTSRGPFYQLKLKMAFPRSSKVYADPVRFVVSVRPSAGDLEDYSEASRRMLTLAGESEQRPTMSWDDERSFNFLGQSLVSATLLEKIAGEEKLDFEVVASDVEATVETTLKENLDLNQSSTSRGHSSAQVRKAVLEWGPTGSTTLSNIFKTIDNTSLTLIGTDILYNPESHRLLLDTLLAFLRPADTETAAQALIAYKPRTDGDGDFFGLAERAGLEVVRVWKWADVHFYPWEEFVLPRLNAAWLPLVHDDAILREHKSLQLQIKEQILHAFFRMKEEDEIGALAALQDRSPEEDWAIKELRQAFTIWPSPPEDSMILQCLGNSTQSSDSTVPPSGVGLSGPPANPTGRLNPIATQCPAYSVVHYLPWKFLDHYLHKAEHNTPELTPGLAITAKQINWQAHTNVVNVFMSMCKRDPTEAGVIRDLEPASNAAYDQLSKSAAAEGIPETNINMVDWILQMLANDTLIGA
ncbi:hypothetical protein MNV49_006881 [Pseudohyphozyma bogoriensis]|nr:hypothetical protein MNV49_006881 [Pseudohyphozyma bogoriensis]